jgi:origin recognition complex subunit 2
VAIEPILDIIVHKWLNGRVPPMDVHDTHLLQQQQQGNNVITTTNGITYPRHGDPLVVQKAIAIGQALSRLVLKSLRPLYVVIHNIDGVGLRNHTAQEALAALVYHSQTAVSGQNALRLVASVDHVNGPLLLWDSTLHASFQWTWKRVSTYRPYIDEVMESNMPDDHKMKNLKRGEATKNTEQQLQQTTKQSTFDVLASFAPRLTQSLHQLVKLQVENKVEWVEYAVLFKRCQLNFTVSSDNQLRVFLGELMDHGIVIADNSNPRKYRVPYGNDGLRQILKFKKSN